MSQEDIKRLEDIIKVEPINYYRLLGVERGKYTEEELKKKRNRLAKSLHYDILQLEASPEMVERCETILKEVNNAFEILKKELISSKASDKQNSDAHGDFSSDTEPMSDEDKEAENVGYSNLWSIKGGIPFTENIESLNYSNDFFNLLKEIGNLEKFYQNTARKYGFDHANGVFHKYMCCGNIAGFTRDPNTKDRTAITGLDRSSIIKILLQHALMNYIVGNRVPGKIINDPNFSSKGKRFMVFLSSINFSVCKPVDILNEIYNDEDLAVSLLGNLNFEYSMPNSEVFNCYKEEIIKDNELLGFMDRLNQYFIDNKELENVEYHYRKKEAIPFDFEYISDFKVRNIMYDVEELKKAGDRTNRKYNNPTLFGAALSKFFRTNEVNSFSRNPETNRRDEIENISRTEIIKTGIKHALMNYMIGGKVAGESINHPDFIHKKEIFNCINSLDLRNMDPEEFVIAIINNDFLSVSILQNIDPRYFQQNSIITNAYSTIMRSNNKTYKEQEVSDFMKKLDNYFKTCGEIPYIDSNKNQRYR